MTARSPKTLQDKWRLAMRLKPFVWPHRWQVAAIVFLLLLTAALEGASLSLIVPLVQVVTSSGIDTVTMPRLFQTYQGWLDGYRVEESLAILGLAIIALFGAKNGLQYLREVLSTKLWLGIGVEARMRLLGAALKQPYRYFLDRKQGLLLQNLYNEPWHVAYLVNLAIEQCANIISVATLIGLLVLVSWQFTAFIVIMGTFYGMTMLRLSRKVDAGAEGRKLAEAEAVALLTEIISGIRQIKIFSAESRMRGVYESYVLKFRELRTHYAKITLLPAHVTEMFWVGVLGIALCLPALGLKGQLENVLPVLAFFWAVAFRVGPYVSKISQGWLNLNFFLPAVEIVQLLDEPEQGIRVPHGRSFRALMQGIQLEDVSFSYCPDHHPALWKASVCFDRGQTTAIIGPSGSGKSTLVDLLVRLYEPSSGRIIVDGIDLREYNLGDWLSGIGFVSQDTFIFNGTIRDNIAFSCPGASNDEIKTAAQKANAHEFIERSPQAYETIVGDRGLKLSGGERQRIAIARALLRDPQILIFDEATSALDNESEALVQEAIMGIARNRTVILIAHRLSTVIRADKILVLEEGRLVQQGTHVSLMREGGVYANLYAKGAV